MRRTRRQVLAATAGVAALAGCTGSGDGGAGGSGEGDGTRSGPTTLADHPALADIESQPARGPPPGEATGTIVAFEDPSCPRCGVFERQTAPEIRSELVAPGDATYVVRSFPNVYRWGERGVRALEATFTRDAEAHWALLEHYFAAQSRFEAAGADRTLELTREFLAADTAVDADAVVSAVENGEADAAVQTDVDAGEAADVSGTPTVFLFRDGEYRTRATGSVGFEFVKTALEL